MHFSHQSITRKNSITKIHKRIHLSTILTHPYYKFQTGFFLPLKKIKRKKNKKKLFRYCAKTEHQWKVRVSSKRIQVMDQKLRKNSPSSMENYVHMSDFAVRNTIKFSTRWLIGHIFYIDSFQLYVCVDFWVVCISWNFYRHHQHRT